MENRYLAKTNPEKTIKEHTADLLKQYEILKQLYPNIMTKEEWELLEYAVKYHDLGKMNIKFQNKLYQKQGYEKITDQNKQEEEVPHNFLSPFFIDTNFLKNLYGEENTKIILSAVYYHHNRDKIEFDKIKMQKELIDQVKNFGEFYSINLKEIKPYSQRYLMIPDYLEDEEQMKNKKYILIKGLLNKLDYIASLNKKNVLIEETVEDCGECVAQKVKKQIKEYHKNNYREVQRYMMENQDENIIVISPCGSGKTEAALLWIGNTKAFYTLPLKISINAIQKRIEEEIKYHKVLLLHSDAYAYYLEHASEYEINSYDRARRLSAPLIITTVDQLFKIVFRYNGYEEILATLSYSKIVIDEIQMYSPELIAYILIGLKMITDMGGKFAIMTATFPPVLYDLLNELNIHYKRQPILFKAPIEKRHKIKIFKNCDFNIEEIKEKAKKYKVLILTNTIKKAQELYENLEGENRKLLHSNYLKLHRKLLENSIMRFTDRNINKENGIWISTTIVEASLDIDFDIVYTDMCSADSLFQRMGRVYRKREYTKEEPNVYIYDNKSGVPKIIDPEIYEFSLQELLKYDGNFLTEEEKVKIIENIFDINKNVKLKESKYYQKIKNRMQLLKEITPYRLEKSEVEKEFRDIKSVSLIPDTIYEALYNEGKIEEWETKLKGKIDVQEKIKIKEEIEKYIITVTDYYGLKYDREELFYPYSNIHRTRYIYEFNEKTLEGRGLIKQEQDDSFI